MRKTTADWLRRLWKSNGRRLIWLGIVLISSLLVLLTPLEQVDAQNDSLSGNTLQGIPPAPPVSPTLPTPQVHPLPLTLAQWQDSTYAGDYFSEIKLTPVDYLVWSQFPVKVYVERPTEPIESSASAQRFHNWVDAVLQAVGEWNVYLPLEVVFQSEGADIAILRSRPPLQASFNRETGKFDSIRARTAETRYEFYLQRTGEKNQAIVTQKFTIQLSPDQSVDFTIATARHELGHALGIWGHSPVETDALYVSQVRNPSPISVRDINTLKRIYQQPTRLGWALEG